LHQLGAWLRQKMGEFIDVIGAKYIRGTEVVNKSVFLICFWAWLRNKNLYYENIDSVFTVR
jgi:hypothetical protein